MDLDVYNEWMNEEDYEIESDVRFFYMGLFFALSWISEYRL